MLQLTKFFVIRFLRQYGGSADDRDRAPNLRRNTASVHQLEEEDIGFPFRRPAVDLVSYTHGVGSSVTVGWSAEAGDPVFRTRC